MTSSLVTPVTSYLVTPVTSSLFTPVTSSFVKPVTSSLVKPVTSFLVTPVTSSFDTHLCTSLKNLKKRKAAGPDGLVAEMFLSSSHIVVPYLLKVFNCIYSAGVFPELWSKAVIIPIYKEGNPNDADNYRGISLTSVFSKIFTGILNKRLTA